MIRTLELFTLSAMGLCVACTGNIEGADVRPQDLIARATQDDTRDSSADDTRGLHETSDAGTENVGDAPYDPEPVEQPTKTDSKVDARTTDKTAVSVPAVTVSTKPDTTAAAPTGDQTALAESMNATVVTGPAPQLAIAGAPFTMIKNWDFGTNGNVRGKADLKNEFQFHDQFGTIANGTNYGAVTVAADEETAISDATGLGLPNNRQPVEDPARPTREWTADGMIAHVRPLSASQNTISAARHDVGNGSITSKWKLDKGGALLGHDLVWETRVRMPKHEQGYWFALWTAGERWAKGAEMDVLESFGTQYVTGNAFHADSVGGVNAIDYVKNWFSALDQVGVPVASRALSEWHTFTWVYLKDDSFDIYYDGYRVQHGTIHWTYAGEKGAEPVDMYFLFDFSWGHTTVNDVNIELPAQDFDLQYEVDYSRVYVR